MEVIGEDRIFQHKNKVPLVSLGSCVSPDTSSMVSDVLFREAVFLAERLPLLLSLGLLLRVYDAVGHESIVLLCVK